MTKASDPRPRPKVAKKGADKASAVYDFVQSPEWQKVLDKARKEQEQNQSKQAQQGNETQRPKSGGQSVDPSATSKPPAKEPTAQSDQIEEASPQQEAVGSRRTGESEEPPPVKPDGGGNSELGDKVSGKTSVTFETNRRKERSTETDRKRHESQTPKPKQTGAQKDQEIKSDEPQPQPASTLAGGDNPESVEGDQKNPELSLRLSTDEVADRLRKKLLQRLAEQKQTRRKLILGLVAIGCVIGVVASSTVFYVLSEWGLAGPRESVDLATLNAEFANTAALQDDEVIQSKDLQTDALNAVEGQTVNAPNVFDTSPTSILPDGNLVKSEDLSSFAALTPPLSDWAEGTEIFEPKILQVAPIVLSFVPELEQPPSLAEFAGNQPRQEAGPSFVRYQSTPELLGTVLALSEEITTNTVPTALFVDAITPPPRSPDALSVAEGDAVISTSALDASQPSISPEGDLAETEDLNSFASLAPPLTESSEIVETNTIQVAPNVLSFIQALEQPSLPTGFSGVPPQQEANPIFVQYQNTPVLFGTVIALSDEIAINSGSISHLVDVIAPLPRPPDVSLQPASLPSPTPLASDEERGSLPKQVMAYQPEAISSINPNASGLANVSSDPSVQSDDAVIFPQDTQPSDLKPLPTQPDSNERLALLGDETEPLGTTSRVGGAEFRLFVPNRLSGGAVDSVVAELTTAGHEISGTDRVGFGISQTNVRFYHKQDAARASALAKDAGALLRDFTGAKSKTPSGIVELWLAGDGAGGSKAKRTTKRSSRSASTNNQAYQLRSQVLQKLRTATNQ